jgi:ribonuclease D
MFLLHLGVMTAPVYCTKIASKLARTYTDRHGLKDVTRELVGVELSKVQQSSDWGAATLSPEQVAYAASDVLHLHALRERLDAMLVREGRMDLAQGRLRLSSPSRGPRPGRLGRRRHLRAQLRAGGMTTLEADRAGYRRDLRRWRGARVASSSRAWSCRWR